MRAIALANQKGGVGKTTTAVHLGHGFALAGLRVGIFDLDPQGNATLATEAMMCESEPELEQLVPLSEGLWLLPSAGAGRSIGGSERLDVEALSALKSRLEGDLDVLLVDCPPRMDEWGLAGLHLCEHVLVPVQAEFFAMHGLSRMLDAAEEARQGSGLIGVFVSMFDHREAVALEIRTDLRTNLGAALFQTVIVRDPQFIEAASHGVSLFDYGPLAKGARCYAALAHEVMTQWFDDVSRETGSL